MEYHGRLEADREARPAELKAKGGHPDLRYFDAIRAVLVKTGLPPDPEIYELLYLYVTGADAALTRAIDVALEEGALDLGKIRELRRIHLGDIAGAELLALVERAQETANRLASRMDQACNDIRAYDAVIAAEDEMLSVRQSVHEMAALVQRLRRANAAMMATNRKLESDIQAAILDTGRILDRLDAAEQAARTDPLTELPNRRGLTGAFREMRDEAERTGVPLTVALADIDHFKRINDLWGHMIGDEVLRCVGQHLQKDARAAAGKHAFVGRYGGEEFLVVMPGISLGTGTAILDRSRGRLASLVLRRKDDDRALGHITFSAGVAELRPGDSFETLVDRADSALYNAKRTGRDRVLPEKAAIATQQQA